MHASLLYFSRNCKRLKAGANTVNRFFPNLSLSGKEKCREPRKKQKGISPVTRRFYRVLTKRARKDLKRAAYSEKSPANSLAPVRVRVNLERASVAACHTGKPDKRIELFKSRFPLRVFFFSHEV